MADVMHERSYKVLATNTLSGASFDARVRAVSQVDLIPPTVERATISCYQGGDNGEVVVHFNPHTLSGQPIPCSVRVLCRLTRDGQALAQRDDSDFDLIGLRGLRREFDVKSDSSALTFAKADGLEIQVFVYAVEPDPEY